MNIWIVSHYAWPPSGPGGTRHHALAQQLIQRRHHVRVFAANFNHCTLETRTVDAHTGYRLCEEDGVPFCWIGVPRYRGNSAGRAWSLLLSGESKDKGRPGLDLWLIFDLGIERNAPNCARKSSTGENSLRQPRFTQD